MAEGARLTVSYSGFPSLPPPHTEHILSLRIWEVGSGYVKSLSAKLGVSSSAPSPICTLSLSNWECGAQGESLAFCTPCVQPQVLEQLLDH